MSKILTKLLKLLTSFLSCFRIDKDDEIEEEDMLSADNFIIYEDRRGKWRWKIKAQNGKIIYASTQGYSNKYLAKKNASILKKVLIEIDKEDVVLYSPRERR